MYATNQFRKGLKVEIDGVPFEIVDYQHVSPGKGRAFTRTKLRNMINQNVIERTITSGDKLDRANAEQKEMQFLYKDAGGFHFMNQESFEQLAITDEQVGTTKDFLKEGLIIQVMFFNERVIGIDLPPFVPLKVTETSAASRGDTVTAGTKPAVVETGATIQVPYHIKEGDVIKVDTRDYSYSEKVNK